MPKYYATIRVEVYAQDEEQAKDNIWNQLWNTPLAMPKFIEVSK
jgi:hypothetical protein